jgi:hypothetical protein
LQDTAPPASGWPFASLGTRLPNSTASEEGIPGVKTNLAASGHQGNTPLLRRSIIPIIS